MKEFMVNDICSMPGSAATYSRSIAMSGGLLKWIPASLIAVFTDIQQAFGTLFWIVGILWLCDFLVGTAKVWMEDPKKLEWSRSFRSFIKLLVMGVGILAIHLIERMLGEAGVQLYGKLTGAALLIIGSTEAISVMDNLTYFFPGLADLQKKIKDLLGKVRSGNGSDQ